ncbi:MAG: ATP-binding protein [Bacilli bacterium]
MFKVLGKIVAIVDNTITVKLAINIEQQVNLVNYHVVLEDNEIKIIGEIEDIDQINAKINIVGEIKNNIFTPGFSKKPAFKSKVRLITMAELGLILGSPNQVNKNQVAFGISTVYNNYQINVDINQFFSNHFAILGNTGSGKSFAVSRLFQNIFSNPNRIPINANIFMFDAYGEYTNAFKNISNLSPLVAYKNYTTDTNYPEGEILRIPLWLLGVDDIAQLLGVTTPLQLPIIEKALKLVTILKDDNENVTEHKNDIIARAIMDLLMSGTESVKIRDQITAVLTNFHTNELNLDSEISQPGYIRNLKQCLFVDKTGKMQEMELVVEFINQFIISGLELKTPDGTVPYTLNDLENAISFALISEGVLKSNKVFDYANILSVRIHSLINSEAKEYFTYPNMIGREDYIKHLMLTKDGKRAQIVNFNINYVDDRMAKVLTKIMSKLLFDFSTNTTRRAMMPFHIIIEEAHRYVQKDTDEELFGYNIFDRITKEGRKYGVLLGLITQRPSELSETSISQCSNFVILRTLHPKDLEYIRNMVPNMSSAMVEHLKTLQPGNCMAFGSAFKVPVAMRLERPNPEPFSSSADIEKIWYQ